MADSEFPLAVTPDLEIEYRQALDHLFVPPYVKNLIRKLLARCERRGFFGFDGPPCAGFDEGRFASKKEIAAIAEVPIYVRANNPLPRNRTDSYLVALSIADLVITADANLIRRWGENRPGLIAWRDVEANHDAGRRLIEVLRHRATRLPGVSQARGATP